MNVEAIKYKKIFFSAKINLSEKRGVFINWNFFTIEISFRIKKLVE